MNWTRLQPSPLPVGLLNPGALHTGSLRPGLLRFALGLWVACAMSLVHPAVASGVYAQQTPAEDQRTVWDGVYTEAQAERGQVLYTESCSRCHAPDLRGDNTSPSLVGMSFTFLWGGSTLGALSEQIQKQMPTDRPGSLSAKTYRDILAFVLRANSYPAGTKELEADDLDYIMISAEPNAGR